MPAKTVRQTNWKKAHKSFKTQKTVKLGLIILGLIILMMIVGKITVFVKSLFQPISQNEFPKHYLWDGSSNINLVVHGQTVSVLSFNPSSSEVRIINIPSNTYMEVPDGRGQWPVSSVYGLGENETSPTGNQLLKRSLSSFLGIPIDDFVEFSGRLKQEDTAQVIDSFKKGPLQVLSDLPQIKTDLSPIEFFRLSWELSGIRFDKFKTINMEGLLKKKSLPDGTVVLTGDSAVIDGLSQKLLESKINDERLSIAVFNSTRYPGLGQKAARLISNLGGNVITISNALKTVKNSQIFGKEDSYTFKRLRQVFVLDCFDNPKCDTITRKEIEDSRADINVILGEDFYQR